MSYQTGTNLITITGGTEDLASLLNNLGTSHVNKLTTADFTL